MSNVAFNLCSSVETSKLNIDNSLTNSQDKNNVVIYFINNKKKKRKSVRINNFFSILRQFTSCATQHTHTHTVDYLVQLKIEHTRNK